MRSSEPLVTRRRLLQGAVAIGAFSLFTPGVFAEQLALTPPLTEGPFYPDKLPLDTDNDLIIIGNSTTPAVGEITHLYGKILNANGDPIKNAELELWQCDASGVYINTRSSIPNADRQDKNFQGYGRFLTSSTGEYRFRTIKPVPYSGRPAPHIHLRVNQNGREMLTTQLFIAGYPSNVRDMVFRGIRDVVDRELVSTEFKLVKDSKIGEYSAHFDLVIGQTPADRDDHQH